MSLLNECQAHMEERPLNRTEKAIYDEATKYESKGEFARGYIVAYKAAIDPGILDKVCMHMKILYNGYWRKALCLQNNN